MIYVLGKRGRRALESFLDSNTLLAFDLDGTLIPIAAQPEEVTVPPDLTRLLETLSASAPVAVITGRALSDALPRLGFAPDYAVGNHGAEGLPGFETGGEESHESVQKWTLQLQRARELVADPGVFIEDKGMTLSVHYRNARNRHRARARLNAAVKSLEPKPRTVAGKCLQNLVPQGFPDKGEALVRLMAAAGCGKAFFIGDDVTDEDVFALKKGNIFTVKVGYDFRSGAGYFLRRQREIIRLLDFLSRACRHFA